MTSRAPTRVTTAEAVGVNPAGTGIPKIPSKRVCRPRAPTRATRARGIRGCIRNRTRHACRDTTWGIRSGMIWRWDRMTTGPPAAAEWNFRRRITLDRWDSDLGKTYAWGGEGGFSYPNFPS
jgi:hypothetical protein